MELLAGTEITAVVERLTRVHNAVNTWSTGTSCRWTVVESDVSDVDCEVTVVEVMSMLLRVKSLMWRVKSLSWRVKSLSWR